MKTSIYFFFAFLLFYNTTFSQPGTLDTHFGNNGIVITELNNAKGTSNTSIQQADGKIIAAGNGGQGEEVGFLLVRYLEDGTIDNSFGTYGYVITDFKDETYEYFESEQVYALAVQPDGKILAAGYGYHKLLVDEDGSVTAFYDIIIARYLPNGNPDSSFGTYGKVVADFSLLEKTSAMQLASDGKIILGGSSAPLPGEPLDRNWDYFLARFNNDGTVDTEFGDNGKVVTDFQNLYYEHINSLALQEDGKIVAGGLHKPTRLGANQKFAIARYNEEGSLDASFGDSGKVITDLSSRAEEIRSIAIQDDGKIIAVGAANVFYFIESDMAVARYNTNGTLDTEFGDDGKVIIKFDELASIAEKVLLQSDGKIILAGNSYSGDELVDFGLARCLSDGSLDETFGENGKTVTPLGQYDDANSALLQKNGKIVIVGTTTSDVIGDYHISLAGYNGDRTDNQLITEVKSWVEENGISWQAQNVDKVAYYAVQASKTGSNFTEVKRVQVEAADNAEANKERIYNYTISNAQANIYYRIRAALLNGKFVYSPVIYYGGRQSLLTVYPNPVKNTFLIKGLNAKENSRLMISNLSGNVMLTATSQNSATYNWNVSSLRPGRYVLTVQSGKTVSTLKFIKE